MTSVQFHRIAQTRRSRVVFGDATAGGPNLFFNYYGRREVATDYFSVSRTGCSQAKHTHREAGFTVCVRNCLLVDVRHEKSERHAAIDVDISMTFFTSSKLTSMLAS